MSIFKWCHLPRLELNFILWRKNNVVVGIEINGRMGSYWQKTFFWEEIPKGSYLMRCEHIGYKKSCLSIRIRGISEY
jgi:hypothetical protein